MKGKEVDLAEHGASSNNSVAVLKEIIAEGLNKTRNICVLLTGSDGGVEFSRKRFPGVFFQNCDNLRRLEVKVLQTPHQDPVNTVLPGFRLLGLAETFNIKKCSDN